MEEVSFSVKDERLVWLGLGSFLVVLLLLSSIFLHNIENLSIQERRVGQILAAPEDFYTATVSMEGKVSNTFGSHGFSVSSPGAIGDELLVISPESLEPVGGSGIQESYLQHEEKVEVEGIVSEFDIKKVEKDLGVDLNDDEFLAWQGRPYILVTEFSHEVE